LSAYVDASVVVRGLLGEPNPLVTRTEWEPLITSQLTAVECRRTIDRLRLTDLYDEEAAVRALDVLATYESRMVLVEVTSEILSVASGPFGRTVIRTLDAVHLATAMLFREHVDPEVLFLTHDRQQAAAAQAVGFEILGIEAST
jgi:predicted nucleic acid-binding protein